MKKAMVVCGFPGIGKSSVANNRVNLVDAESSAYSWIWDAEKPEEAPKRNPRFPENYIEAIQEERSVYQHDFVFVSCHKEVREALIYAGIPYIVVAPSLELKNEYMIRYLQRGSSTEFIEKLYEKWDEYLKEIAKEDAPVIWLKSGQYLSDVIGVYAV